jgi:hypothetical protein
MGLRLRMKRWADEIIFSCARVALRNFGGDHGFR